MAPFVDYVPCAVNETIRKDTRCGVYQQVLEIACRIASVDSSAALEVWVPLVNWRLSRKGRFHAEVEESAQYIAFLQASGRVWDRFHLACLVINKVALTSFIRPSSKSPRPVTTKEVSFDYVMTTLLNSSLFCAAHAVACHGRSHVFLVCPGCTSSQVKSSILSFCEVDDTFDRTSILVTSLTTDAAQSTVEAYL